MQAVRGDAIQSGVIKDDNAICTARKTAKCEQRIVRLNNDVTDLILVGEDAVGLDELLGEMI